MPFYKGDMLQKAALLRKKQKGFQGNPCKYKKTENKECPITTFLLDSGIYVWGGGKNSF